MEKPKSNCDAQRWQIIPRKDSMGYVMKSLYNSGKNNMNGVYVDSSYNNSWVTLEEATEITLWITMAVSFFGSESKEIARCLENFDVCYKEIKTVKDIDDAIRNNKIIIMSIWNSPTIFDGIHTFAARYDISENEVEFYNYECAYNETSHYESVEGLMKSDKREAIIRGYAITR